jgi:hypothetical protein
MPPIASGCSVEDIADERTLPAHRRDRRRQGVGWFQGRMGGPARSQPLDRRTPARRHEGDPHARSNGKIRPFARRCLKIRFEWFEEDDRPLMMQVFQIRPSVR